MASDAFYCGMNLTSSMSFCSSILFIETRERLLVFGILLKQNIFRFLFLYSFPFPTVFFINEMCGGGIKNEARVWLKSKNLLDWFIRVTCTCICLSRFYHSFNKVRAFAVHPFQGILNTKRRKKKQTLTFIASS